MECHVKNIDDWCGMCKCVKCVKTYDDIFQEKLLYYGHDRFTVTAPVCSPECVELVFKELELQAGKSREEIMGGR